MTSRRMVWALFVSVLCIGLLGQGCSCGGEPLGDLQVSWVFKETVKCADNVDTIVVKVDGLKGRLVPCSEGTFRIPSLEGGKHMVVVTGLDKHQAVTWRTAPLSVIVVEGDLVVKQVILEPANQGAVQFAWQFDGDAKCPKDVQQVSIQIDGNEGGVLVQCAAGVHKVPGISEGEHNVVLKGMTENGEVVWKSESQAFYIKTLAEAHIKVDLKSLKPRPGELLVKWLFSGEAYCPSDVANVVIQITGQKDVLVACTEGEYKFPALLQGEHTIKLLGLDDADGITWESLEAKSTVKPNQKNELSSNLAPVE